MISPYDAWQSDLANLLSDTLHEVGGAIDEELESFAIDCHPWNGVIALAFLTSAEANQDATLRDAAEMAAWKHYDFAAALTSSQAIANLGIRMRAAYEAAGSNRRGTASDFLRSCAAAAASKQVQEALSAYRLARNFSITVPHPDTGEEYFAPK